MASLTISKKEFESHVKLNEEIESKISMLGTPVESVSEDSITIDVSPNRPDLLSSQGFMRSFLQFLGKKPGLKEYKINKSTNKIIVDKSVQGIRPYSMAAIVKGVKLDEEKIIEIMNWQEKIHSTLGRNRKKVALGYYVLDKIKFPVKYTAKKPEEIVFEPLEMPEKMNAIKILQRHPTGRDYAYHLEGLEKFPVYLDSNNEVLSMPPIINSNSLGKITPGTNNILIECSGFDLGLLKKVITIAVCDLIDLQGEAYSVEINYGKNKEAIDLKPEKIKINLDNINKLLGLNLKEQEIKKLLEKMGYSYNNKQVLIPAYRTDILHEVDIAEDIAIAYGYENFIPEIPKISTIGEESRQEIIKRKITEILTGLGLLEVSSFHLTNKHDQFLRMELKAQGIAVQDSKSEYNLLRESLLHKSLKILSENVDNEYPQKIFELGRVFLQDDKEETGIKEQENLAISLTPANFTELKQALDYLMKMLNLEYKLENHSDSKFIEGRAGSIIINNNKVGILGEIHPQLLKNWHIKMPVASLEISLDEIFKKLN
jgi:phenylalanyl-tRNA synthetase beta chain